MVPVSPVFSLPGLSPTSSASAAIGSILGFIAFSWAVGGAVGPFVAAYIFDISRSYTISFMSAGLLLIVAIAAISQLKER
jgi:nitrate/nitrite transporter NarK